MNTVDQNINIEDLKLLLDTTVETCYKVTEEDSKTESFVFNCLKLFEKDYTFSIINNERGELCPHYPSSIVIVDTEKVHPATTNGTNTDKCENSIDPVQLTDLLQRSRFARYRTHFPVPVIHFEGKRICRSGTVAESPENYSEGDLEKFYHIRDLDLQVLNQYSIGHIYDLMVEKVKVKYGIRVASSEKTDRRYTGLTLSTIPYPGCEYFTVWRLNGYVGRGLVFDWAQKMVEVEMELPQSTPVIPGIVWTQYKQWDIITLTQNYLKLFLQDIVQGNCGVMMHCISGWHRTPMFISLLRLSLWADMAIHQSLGPLDILYLTVAYDWFLFGHNFQCLVKGEDIFAFCFDFLNYITSEDFSVSSFKTINQSEESEGKHHTTTDQSDAREESGTRNHHHDFSQCQHSSKSVPSTALPEASKTRTDGGEDHCDEFWEMYFTETEESPRKQRLDAVRKIFLNNFKPVNGKQIPTDPDRSQWKDLKQNCSVHEESSEQKYVL